MAKKKLSRIKLLIILSRWPPEITPRAIHNQKLVEALSKEFDVMTVRPLIKNSLPNSANVIQVYNFRNSYLNRLFEKMGLSFKLPDPHLISFFTGIGRIFRAVKQFEPKLILSISKFDSSHLIANILKNKFNIPWIMFMSDPWTDMQDYGYVRYNFIERAINKKMEILVFNNSDKIIVTNKSIVKILSDRVDEQKLIVIPQFFNEGEVSKPSKINLKQKAERKLIIRHFGHFYGPRSPLPFLQALKKMQSNNIDVLHQTRVEFYGRLDCWNADECLNFINCMTNVTIHESVTRENVGELANTSDMLMLIDAVSEFSPFLPSKLIDYLSYRKPIFSITPPGAAYDVTCEGGCFVADPGSTESIIITLQEILSIFGRNKLEAFTPSTQFIEQYSSRIVLARYKKVLMDELS